MSNPQPDIRPADIRRPGRNLYGNLCGNKGWRITITCSVAVILVVAAMIVATTELRPTTSSTKPHSEPLLQTPHQVSFVQEQEPSPSRKLRDVQREYLDEIRPLLKDRCGKCHWGAGADGDLDFEPFMTLDDLLRATTKWKDVVEVIEDEEMPPEDEPQLTDPEKQKINSWIDELLNTLDCTEINPGRVTIRRLNRTEYRNTIRDLVGIDYEPAADFPGDDVGYGFDNIADVLSLPPILMEQYLDASETILDRALGTPDDSPLVRRFPASKMRESDGYVPARGEGRCFVTSGTLTRDIAIPTDGRYRFRIEAAADQFGDEKAKLEIKINNRSKVVDVHAATDEYEIIQRNLQLDAGAVTLELSFINDAYEEDVGDRNLYLRQIVVEGPLNIPPSYEEIVFTRPSGQLDHRTAAARVIRRFTSRAFRRTATKDEVSRLLDLYVSARSEGDTYDAALKYTLQAVLVSPHFLYKIENPPGGETKSLSQFEQATALSYFLWTTMPDDQLMGLAFEDDLNDKAYQEQVQRMMADPRFDSLVQSFFTQWFQLRSLPDFEPDPTLFPDVDRNLRRQMATETTMLAADIVKRNASLLELFTADYTFVNETLARHYDIKDVSGDQFRRIRLPDGERGGILTHASILTLTSNPTRTSPVKRGKWIQENLLGEEPTFPDPDIMALEDQSELTGTLREKMEQHRKDPACASCHEQMDAFGFSLENFDAVGRWREKDEGLPVDATGVLPDGTEFTGAGGLKNLMQDQLRQKFLRCFAEKLLIYSLGRGLEYYDECAVDEILKYAQEKNYTFNAFVIAVTRSEPFRKRKGTGP